MVRQLVVPSHRHDDKLQQLVFPPHQVDVNVIHNSCTRTVRSASDMRGPTVDHAGGAQIGMFSGKSPKILRILPPTNQSPFKALQGLIFPFVSGGST